MDILIESTENKLHKYPLEGLMCINLTYKRLYLNKKSLLEIYW
jgi:hypothetical protein